MGETTYCINAGFPSTVFSCFLAESLREDVGNGQAGRLLPCPATINMFFLF